jgi:hypothetical protein
MSKGFRQCLRHFIVKLCWQMSGTLYQPTERLNFNRHSTLKGDGRLSGIQS